MISLLTVLALCASSFALGYASATNKGIKTVQKLQKFILDNPFPTRNKEGK